MNDHKRFPGGWLMHLCVGYPMIASLFDGPSYRASLRSWSITGSA